MLRPHVETANDNDSMIMSKWNTIPVVLLWTYWLILEMDINRCTIRRKECGAYIGGMRQGVDDRNKWVSNGRKKGKEVQAAEAKMFVILMNFYFVLELICNNMYLITQKITQFIPKLIRISKQQL